MKAKPLDAPIATRQKIHMEALILFVLFNTETNHRRKSPTAGRRFHSRDSQAKLSLRFWALDEISVT